MNNKRNRKRNQRASLSPHQKDEIKAKDRRRYHENKNKQNRKKFIYERTIALCVESLKIDESDFDVHFCGDLSKRCQHCQALHFEEETATLCCSNG